MISRTVVSSSTTRIVSPWPRGVVNGRSIQIDRILQGPRQIKLDGRALSHLAVDAEMTTALLGEAVDHGKSQAGSLSDRLGGEEWIDRFGHHVRRHPGSRVRNADDDVVAWFNIVLERRCNAASRSSIRRFDRQPTAIRHGVARIDGEIQKGALELVGIGEGGPEIGGKRASQLDLLAQGAVKQIFHARDEAVDIVGPGVKRLAPGEREKPMRQRRRAQRRSRRRVHEARDVVQPIGRHASAHQYRASR